MFSIRLKPLVMVLCIVQSTPSWGMLVYGPEKAHYIKQEIITNFLRTLPASTENNVSFYDTVNSIEILEKEANKREDLLSLLSDYDAARLINHKLEYIENRLHEKEVDAWKKLIRFCGIPLRSLPFYESMQKLNKNMLLRKNWNASWDTENLPELWMDSIKQNLKEHGIKATNIALGIAEGNSFYAHSVGTSLGGTNPVISLNKKVAYNPIIPTKKAEMISAAYHECMHILQGNTMCFERWREKFTSGNYWKKFGKTSDDAVAAVIESEKFKKWQLTCEQTADVLIGLNNKEIALYQIMTFQNGFEGKGSRLLYPGSINYLVAIYKNLDYLEFLQTKKNVLDVTTEEI